MDDPTSLPPHKWLKSDATTTSDPDAPQEVSLSNIQEEDLVPPRKKLKKDDGHSMSTAHLPSSSHLLPRAVEEDNNPILAQIMDQCKMQQHKEEDVGITEFVNPGLPGFTGILKKRYVSKSEFILKAHV